jgi:hypothetical protein
MLPGVSKFPTTRRTRSASRKNDLRKRYPVVPQLAGDGVRREKGIIVKSYRPIVEKHGEKC